MGPFFEKKIFQNFWMTRNIRKLFGYLKSAINSLLNGKGIDWILKNIFLNFEKKIKGYIKNFKFREKLKFRVFSTNYSFLSSGRWVESETEMLFAKLLSSFFSLSHFISWLLTTKRMGPLLEKKIFHNVWTTWNIR